MNDKFNLKTLPNNLKLLTMNSNDACGPCWARYLIQQYWQGEQYYLQVDSHTRFVKDWDLLLKDTIKSLPIKSCLSNYVSTFNIDTGKVDKSPLRGPMYVSEFDYHDKFCRFNTKYIKDGSMAKSEISKGWSGCFSFSSSQIILDAPYDPYTPFLFFGEEMDIYARLYTRGWLMYVPHIPICFTLFDRSYRKTFWEHPDCKEVAQLSRTRLYDRFGWQDNVNSSVLKDKKIYDLGKQRTMKQFMQHIQ
jgi:[Skp1-protein]-hydroxyproline N-acetylglucosaminyltransferase